MLVCVNGGLAEIEIVGVLVWIWLKFYWAWCECSFTTFSKFCEALALPLLEPGRQLSLVFFCNCQRFCKLKLQWRRDTGWSLFQFRTLQLLCGIDCKSKSPSIPLTLLSIEYLLILSCPWNICFSLLQFHVIIVFLSFLYLIFPVQCSQSTCWHPRLTSLSQRRSPKGNSSTIWIQFWRSFFLIHRMCCFFFFFFWILDTNFVNLFLFLSLFWFTESVISSTYFCGYLIANLALIWIQFWKFFIHRMSFL